MGTNGTTLIQLISVLVGAAFLHYVTSVFVANQKAQMAVLIRPEERDKT